MQHRILPDPRRTASLLTNELRDTFLVEDLFQPETLTLTSCDLDRVILGGAVPGTEPLSLEAVPSMRVAFFCERRELGILNIGGPGHVEVDAQSFAMGSLDCLYIGRDSQSIRFHSESPANPAVFYLVSYPAHATHPTQLARHQDAVPEVLGSSETCNARRLYKRIAPGMVQSCQLVMGYTVLEPGSCWNTMPPHTHQRRSEVYLYFDMDPAHRVFHMMGEAQETRHLTVGSRQAVFSPSWSIHSGVGTSHYTFCWAMGGENQTFNDMDAVSIAELR